jgi:hypothetical protein
MNDEQFLVAAYFGTALACAGLAVSVFLVLRRSFAALTAAVPGGGLGGVLRRLLLAGLVLPTMAAFCSVTFVGGCSDKHATYRAVLADRAYLVAKNEEQLAKSCDFLSHAVLAWAAIASLGIVAGTRGAGPDPRTGG